MKILVNGCSHSKAIKHGGGITTPWYGNLEYDVVSLATGGKDNEHIFTDTVKYLYTEPQTPDIVIIQWTEFHRVSQVPTLKSEDFNGDDYYDGSTELWIKYHIPFKRNGLDERLGHCEFLPEQVGVIAKTKALKAICDQLGVRLIIFNWHGFGKSVNTKLGMTIDPSIMLIENWEWGLTNHLGWCGFEMVDGIHYNNEGNEYIANRVDDMIKNNKRMVVEDVPFDRKRVIFDYTFNRVVNDY